MKAVERRLASVVHTAGVPHAESQLRILLEALGDPAAPTAIHDPLRAIDVHIADSLTGLALSELSDATEIVDLGAGAGLPGLVLAAALPRTHVFLLESARRKCEFLASGASAMGLRNTEIVCVRAEEWDDGLGRCAAATARAVAALPVLCEYAAPLLRLGGSLVAWKGLVDDAEAGDGAAAAEHLGLAPADVHPVVPYSGSERRSLHVFRKVAPAPAGYPRRAGMATKRPLSATTLR